MTLTAIELPMALYPGPSGQDDRFEYGESRFQAFGYVDGVAFALVHTPRNGVLRIISSRGMHKKETLKNGL